MKKKNLIILLLMPFVIAILCIVTVNITYDAVDVDISHIDWNYDDFEPFKITDGTGYKLVASGVNRNNYKLADGNELVWTVQNKSGEGDPLAEIVKSGESYYLKTLGTGEVVVTCSTLNGNISRSMTAVIYDNAVLIAQPTINSSQSNIDSTVYYGEFDLEGQSKKGAVIDMKITAIPESIISSVTYKTSDNIVFDKEKSILSIVNTGHAVLTLESDVAPSVSFEFEIVKNGVNVYTYEDLLNCTNRSENGEIVVLRKHFESVENAYIQSGTTLTKRANNVECFGNYNPRTKKYTFADEIYYFTTTYNKNYIDQWNEFVKINKNYSSITDQVKAGLRIQKDFYGNGYTINLHNLTFPYGEQEGTSGQSIPMLTSDNLFRGPLPFYTLGDPNDVPLVSALGQDNIGVYVNGDGIIVNDVNIKNCDFGDRIANLDTVGTVMEIYGDNVTVKNSRLSNGKNVLRAFSSNNFLLKNCLLTSSRNFLFATGANEYIPVDGSIIEQFTDIDGNYIRQTIDEYLSKDAAGDTAFNKFLTRDFSTDNNARTAIKTLIQTIHDAMNSSDEIKNNFKGSSVVEDCLFYKSGISAISVDSMFNGPFLYCASPTLVSSTFTSEELNQSKSLIPYTATKVAGMSYPVKLTIKGDTMFYDYKTAEQFDLSGLISENISTIANQITSGGYSITIDDIFPLKTMMLQRAYNLNYTHNQSGSRYVNVPVAYYGGGINLSQVTFEGANRLVYSDKISMDLLESYLNLKGGSEGLDLSNLRNIMMKTVTTVIGYEPFHFHFVKNGYLYGETPHISQLIDNAKGDK